MAVFGVESLTETVSRSIAERRFTMLILGIFAVVALALAAIGIYGVVSYTVTNRTVELGIRMALGADAGRVLRLVVGGGLALAVTGVGIGVLGAWALTRLLESLLFGVVPTDPTVFAMVSAALLVVGALASYLPVHMASLSGVLAGISESFFHLLIMGLPPTKDQRYFPKVPNSLRISK